MSVDGARERVDDVRAGSLQRVVLTLIATALPPGACALAAVANPAHRSPALVLVVIGFIAFVSAIEPDGQLPLITIVIVTWYWIDAVPDHASAWSMMLAALIYLFHTLTALMAMTPTSATIDRATLWRYTARSGMIGLVVVATWAIVEVFSGRHAPGNAVLTGAVVVLLIGAAFTARAVSLGSRSPVDAERIDA